MSKHPEQVPSYKALLVFVQRLAAMPTLSEDMTSTWNPPGWEELEEWWPTFVEEARRLTGQKYRSR